MKFDHLLLIFLALLITSLTGCSSNQQILDIPHGSIEEINIKNWKPKESICTDINILETRFEGKWVPRARVLFFHDENKKGILEAGLVHSTQLNRPLFYIKSTSSNWKVLYDKHYDLNFEYHNQVQIHVSFPKEALAIIRVDNKIFDIPIQFPLKKAAISTSNAKSKIITNIGDCI